MILPAPSSLSFVHFLLHSRSAADFTFPAGRDEHPGCRHRYCDVYTDDLDRLPDLGVDSHSSLFDLHRCSVGSDRFVVSSLCDLERCSFCASCSHATGNTACTNYRLVRPPFQPRSPFLANIPRSSQVYPAACCPNSYLKLTPPAPIKQRRAVTLGKRSITFFSTVTVAGPPQTVISTIFATSTVSGGAATVTSTATIQEAAATPYTT
jgi:hypothetical protein